MMCLRMGKRIHLSEFETASLAEGLNEFFDLRTDIARMRHGSSQTVDTLISEESSLLARFLRNENEAWTPRVVLTRV